MTKPSTATACHLLAGVTLSAAAEGDPIRTYSGVANSGKPFLLAGKPAVVDFEGITHHDTVPALLLHDRAARVGVGKLSVTAEGLTISGTLLNNEHGKQVAAEADQGFPWQMSAHVVPAQVDTLPAGKTATVNGHTVTGPMQILRRCAVREVSFTPTGVDSATSAVVLSDDGQIPESITSEDNMTLEEALKKIKELDERIAALEKENQTLKDEKSAAENDKHTLEVDALLSAAGFERSADGKGWQGLSASTYGLLLSATPEAAKAMIGDLAPRRAAEGKAAEWLSGTQIQPGSNQGEGVKLSDSPLLANADARGKSGGAFI